MKVVQNGTTIYNVGMRSVKVQIQNLGKNIYTKVKHLITPSTKYISDNEKTDLQFTETYYINVFNRVIRVLKTFTSCKTYADFVKYDAYFQYVYQNFIKTEIPESVLHTDTYKEFMDAIIKVISDYSIFIFGNHKTNITPCTELDQFFKKWPGSKFVYTILGKISQFPGSCDVTKYPNVI